MQTPAPFAFLELRRHKPTTNATATVALKMSSIVFFFLVIAGHGQQVLGLRDCGVSAQRNQCFSIKSACYNDCGASYSNGCWGICDSQFSSCNLGVNQIEIACIGGGGGGGGTIGGGGGAGSTTFNIIEEECQELLRVNGNPASLSFLDMQFLVDNASKGNCADVDTFYLVEPFVDSKVSTTIARA